MRFVFLLAFLAFTFFPIKSSTAAAAAPAAKSFVETLVDMARKEKPQDKPKLREKLVFKQLSALFPDIFKAYAEGLFTGNGAVFALPNVMHESTRKAQGGILDPQFSITLTATCFDKAGKPLINACPFEFKDKNGETIQGKIYVSSDFILPGYLQTIRTNTPPKITGQAKGTFPIETLAPPVATGKDDSTLPVAPPSNAPMVINQTK